MRNVSICSLVLGVLLLVGCGGAPSDQPDVGTVTGKVTLNGEPLPNATVNFMPENGRSSTATTNEKGEYELQYTVATKGAKVGRHTVSVTTFQPGDPEDPQSDPGVEEKVPPKYNSQTTLTKEVKPGENVIDLELML